MTTPTVPIYELQQNQDKWMYLSHALGMLIRDRSADDWRTQIASLLRQWGFPVEDEPETWRDYDKGRISGRLAHSEIPRRSNG